LGRTGASLSVIGFGGIMVMEETPTTARAVVDEAIDLGVNYFDVAPTYGNAQERLGPALVPHRDQVFLACKTMERGADPAWRELRESLDLLRTDHFDLYQLHGLSTPDEVDQIFAPGGAIETLVAARDQGLVRHLGFSAHSESVALDVLDRFDFDSILYPLNWWCWHEGGFGPAVLDKALTRGVGVLAIKACARRRLADGEARPWAKCWYEPVGTAEEVARGVRFTLSRPVTAAVSPGHIEHLRWMCEAAESLTPLDENETAALLRSGVGLEPLFRHDAAGT
jgi:aryl-alcohol dehydrogenase-like predicted oxidoreductase